MFKVITKFPKELEDKSIIGVTAIVEVDLAHVKGNLTFDLPTDFNDKTFAETLEKCEQIFYDEKYKDKAQSEKFNELTSKIAEADDAIEKSKTQSANAQKAFLDMVSLFYTKGLINDDDLATITL